MNKFHKFITFLTVLFTVGLTYAIFTIKGMPDAFDWDNEDE